jgi:hypothetical protein
MKITINKTKIVEAIYNEKRLAVIFGVLFVLSLLPILAIAFYNHPGVDDFGFGWKPRHAFMATHNLFAVIAAALETIGDYYYTWQGTFVSVFLFSLNPAVYNEAFYPATTFFMLFILTSSTAFFLQTVFVKGLGLARKYVVLIGVPILFFSIQTPILARHAFFWYNSATHYTLFYSLMLFLLGMCLRLWKAAPPVAASFWLKAALAAVLCFLISGGNYITALMTVIIMVAIVAACFVFRRSPLIKATFIALLLLLLAGFLVNVLAPGHAVRQTKYESLGAMAAIIQSFRYAIHYISSLDLRIVSALLFLSPVFYKMAKQTSYSFKHPWLVALFSFCLYAAEYAPAAYTMSSIGDERVRNIIYFSFVLMVFLNYFYLVGYTVRSVEEQRISLNKEFLVNCAAVASVFAVVFVISSANRLWDHTSVIAAGDLYNGSARQYSTEMKARFRLFHDDNIKQVEVPPLSFSPVLLNVDPLAAEKDHWLNKEMARFYQKEYVVVVEGQGNSP